MKSLTTAWSLMGASLRSQLDYRLSFFLQSLSNVFFLIADFTLLSALIAKHHTLNGWTLAECGFFFFLIQSAYTAADLVGSGWLDVSQLVRAGHLERILLRPMSPLLQLVALDLRLRRVFKFVVSGGCLCYFAAQVMPGYSPLLFLAGVAWVSFGIVLFYLGITLLVGSVSLRLFELNESANILVNGSSNASCWPLDIYRGPLRLVLQTALPLWFVFWEPARTLLQGTFASQTPGVLFWGPALGGAVLLAALVFWQHSLRHFQSTGS